MKTVLITGGAGFIGSHLTDAMIRKGYHAVVFDNLSTGSRAYINPKATFVRGDVRNARDVDRAFARFQPSVVFHVAGQASQITAFTDPTYDIRENFEGTVSVVSSCLRYRVPRLLYASSMTVYGVPKRLPVSETEACAPISYYGISKYAAERFVMATAQRSDLSHPFFATALRMFNVYGPRQSLTNPYQGIMAILVGRALRHEPIVIYGDGKQTRDFVYIDDVVRIWTRAVSNRRTFNEVINIGFGSQMSLRALVKLLQPTPVSIEYHPARPGEQRYMQADMKKQKKLMGFSPGVSVAEGIAKTYAWIQKYGQ